MNEPRTGRQGGNDIKCAIFTSEALGIALLATVRTLLSIGPNQEQDVKGEDYNEQSNIPKANSTIHED